MSKTLPLETLETSLVEWKRLRCLVCSELCLTLETSLVEWKQGMEGIFGGRCKPLETSLVEWKPDCIDEDTGEINVLGNFLSGMETAKLQPQLYTSTATLETSLVEWKPLLQTGWSRVLLPLETSLVEWKHEFFPGIIKAFLPWKLP